ncbi:MAG: HAD-IA family hydrolase [Candidatus Rifleibacteriota bacterium]
MSKWEHVFWDWNGTLLDDVDECIKIINVSLQKRNLKPIGKIEYLEKFQFPVKKYYEAIGFDFSRETFENAGKEYINAYSDRMFACSLHASAIDVLEKFHDAGISQYIVSALNFNSLERCVTSFGLTKFFKKIKGLDDHYAYSKIELGRELIAEIGIDPKKAVLIGDTLHDYETACAMGIDCILIAAGHNSSERLQKCGVPVFDDLGSLYRKIEEMI